MKRVYKYFFVVPLRSLLSNPSPPLVYQQFRLKAVNYRISSINQQACIRKNSISCHLEFQILGGKYSHSDLYFSGKRESQFPHHPLWKISEHFLYYKQHLEIIVQLLLANHLKISGRKKGECFLLSN